MFGVEFGLGGLRFGIPALSLFVLGGRGGGRGMFGFFTVGGCQGGAAFFLGGRGGGGAWGRFGFRIPGAQDS